MTSSRRLYAMATVAVAALVATWATATRTAERKADAARRAMIARVRWTVEQSGRLAFDDEVISGEAIVAPLCVLGDNVTVTGCTFAPADSDREITG